MRRSRRSHRLTQEAVLVLGSSGLGRAFVPVAFDDALDNGRGRFVSYNLAQPLLQPETALAMAKPIRQTLRGRACGIGITIFGISVPELKRGAVGAARRGCPIRRSSSRAPETLYDRARDDLPRRLADGLQLALFGNVRPRAGRSLARRLAFGDSSALRVRHDAATGGPGRSGRARGLLPGAACPVSRAACPPGTWARAARIDFGLPATRPMLERLATLQTFSPSPPRTRSVAGQLAFPATRGRAQPNANDPNDIDEDAVRTMAAAVQELKARQSSHVCPPRHPEPGAPPARVPAELAHWRDVAGRIARAERRPLLDFNDGTFVPLILAIERTCTPWRPSASRSLLAARMRPLVQDDRASR